MNLSISQCTLSVAALAVALALPAGAAEIYKTYDENGNPIFTDQAPEPGAEPITLRELSVVEAPEYARPDRAAGEGDDATTSLNALRRQYRDFALVSPAPEQNFWGTGHAGVERARAAAGGHGRGVLPQRPAGDRTDPVIDVQHSAPGPGRIPGAGGTA